MKLHLIPARTGLHWVRLGIRTFFRQPLALAGLFFMFLAAMSLASLLPVVGLPLALALLPACTLGFMAASKEAGTGRFPMPTVFLSAFRAGRQQLRAILVLGLLYGAAFWIAIGITALFDGGDFATRYLQGQMPTPEMAQNADTQMAMLVLLLLQLPISMMFWHAPALVHWHQVPPIKSVFFSLVACLRNFGAFALFAVTWLAILIFVMFCVGVITSLTGTVQTAGEIMLAAYMLIAVMFLTSTYFSFRDCFDAGEGIVDESTPSARPL